MSTREQFGGYLLLKKLGEDPLGETFRAGKIGRQGLDRVVLLRVFNGPGIDGPRLWQRVSQRAAVHQVLKSPNLGDGVDMGEVRGTPYVAYDYISGKNLATLFEQAEKRRSPFPLDHALLIGERLAQGVAVAYDSRLGDERVLHGFLVPHLVMLSNEGETRLLGFEVAPGLREVASSGGAREQFARYLAPEALGGEGPHKADDVYSLGAILFELLTGKRLPPPAATGYGTLIDKAMLPIEGTAIPAEIGALLKRSLAPRDQRLGDATLWHKELAKTMADGHYNPTTFNLAFFMHNLLREEIEREAQEIAAEKRLPVPAPVAAAPSAPSAAAAERYGARDETLGGTAAGAAPSGNKGMMIGIAAAAVLAIAGGAYWAMTRSAAPPPPPSVAAPAPSVAEPAPAPPVSTGPSAEDLQKQIAALADNQQDLKKYDEQIKLLQKQLEEARRAAERPAAPTRTAAAEPAPAPASTSASTPTTPTTVAAPAPTTPANPPASTSPSSPATSEPAAPAAAAPAPAPTDPAPAQPASSAAPTVRFGDLVTMGPGVSAPKLVRSPSPAYPEIARRTNRTATVVVSVLVDENGRVVESRIRNKVGMGFDEAAQRAARGATYTPATKNGVKVRMWAELAVSFKP